MFDIDAGRRPFLRLDVPSRADLQAERAEIRRQIDALWLRYCDLVLKSDAQTAQSQPIRVSPMTLTMSTDMWDHRHRVMTGGPKIARTTGQVDTVNSVERQNGVVRQFIEALGYEGLSGGIRSGGAPEFLHEDDGA